MLSPSSVAQTTVTPCDGTETGWYNSCIHVGEIKKFEMTNLSDCTGITASDTLGAFNWICVVQNGKVFVYSTGLKYEKNLSDLIDFTAASFLDNSVTVLKEGQTTSVATSTPNKWWTNPILEQNSGASLNTEGTIYIVNQTATGQYIHAAKKTALVVKPDLTVTHTSTIITNSAGTSFLWTEGKFRVSVGVQIGFDQLTNEGKFWVLRNLNIVKPNAGTEVFKLNSTIDSGMYIHNSKSILFSNGSTNFNMDAQRVTINGLLVSNSTTGFNINKSNLISLNLVSLNFLTRAISCMATNSNHFIANSLAGNSSGFGIDFQNISSEYSLMNFVAVNNSDYGIGYSSATVSNLNFINTYSGHNGANAVFNTSAGTSNISYKGNLKFLANTCSVTSTTAGVNNSCTRTIPSELTPTTVIGASLTNSFVGKVTEDQKNTVDASGLSSSNSHQNDPFNFENFYRIWGLESTDITDSGVRGSCNAPTCRIWDYSLKDTDNSIRNSNSCPLSTITDNQNFISPSSTKVFLRNAVELLFDGVGNDDGICESNEDCLYTPNIGAYQGHGRLIKANAISATNSNLCPDIDSGGTVQNIKLWKYETNGYNAN